MKKLLNERELRKEYEEYKLKWLVSRGIGLSDIMNMIEKAQLENKDLNANEAFEYLETNEKLGLKELYPNYEEWLKREKGIDVENAQEYSIKEILESRYIWIEQITKNIIQYNEVDLDSITIPFNKNKVNYNYIEDNFESTLECYNIYEKGVMIKECIDEDELNKYLSDLYNQYNN